MWSASGTLGSLVPDDDFDVIAAAPEEEALTWDREEYREKLVAIYRRSAPAKLGNVDDLLAKYAHALPALVAAIEAKYPPPPPRSAGAEPREPLAVEAPRKEPPPP